MKTKHTPGPWKAVCCDVHDKETKLDNSSHPRSAECVRRPKVIYQSALFPDAHWTSMVMMPVCLAIVCILSGTGCAPTKVQISPATLQNPRPYTKNEAAKVFGGYVTNRLYRVELYVNQMDGFYRLISFDEDAIVVERYLAAAHREHHGGLTVVTNVGQAPVKIRFNDVTRIDVCNFPAWSALPFKHVNIVLQTAATPPDSLIFLKRECQPWEATGYTEIKPGVLGIYKLGVFDSGGIHWRDGVSQEEVNAAYTLQAELFKDPVATLHDELSALLVLCPNAR